MSLEVPPKNKRGCSCLSHFFLLSYHLSFQDKRQRIKFVGTFDKEHCALSAAPHTKLQKILVGRIHHSPPLPYQLGIFGFLLKTTVAHVSGTQHTLRFTLMCLSHSPRQHILLFKVFSKKQKQEASFNPLLNLPVTNCTHPCRAILELQFANKGRTCKDISLIFC